MRIVLDANILIAALLGSRGKLTILTSQNHEFFVPMKIIEEVRKYERLIIADCINFRKFLLQSAI